MEKWSGVRSHPPFVMDGSIVRLSLKEGDKNKGSGDPSVEMLVLTSHGSFSVFTVLPVPKLQFKGTVMPAMNQMRLSASLRANQRNNDSAMFPELSRIVFTDSKHLLLILYFSDLQKSRPCLAHHHRALQPKP